jgi:diguanylate cyclase (GGDEF)-like protein
MTRSEVRRLQTLLRRLADRDPLTGLLSRRAFERGLDREVGAGDTTGALIVLDLDHFKHVNDRLGHSVGDRLISAVALTLQRRLRRTDLLARLGGDEFGVLLPGADRTAAERVAAELLERVRMEAVAPGRNVTASAGIATFGAQDPAPADEVLVNADIALYEAKEAGRDQTAVFEPEQSVGIRATLDWAERIQVALQTDSFELHLQPILDLGTGAVRQHEVLLRMRSDDGDLILPGAFLEVAERFDLIQEIDRWVATRAIRLLGEMARAGQEVTFEVNVSGRSIGDEELLLTIERELAAADVPPSRLVLEITETAAVANIAQARAFAARLEAVGCRFALDDFGAGFGSFYYLKHLPFDFLKIDGEFIREACSTPTDRLIIAAVVQIAAGLGKHTIAEFVADEPTLELVGSFGVDFAQGFHVGKPVPAGDLFAHAPA